MGKTFLLICVLVMSITVMEAQGQTKAKGKVMRDVVYKTVGDRKVLLDIYFPEKQKYKKAPVFYYTHGTAKHATQIRQPLEASD